MKSPRITRIIKAAVARCEMSAADVSKETGIPYQTLMYRYRNPGTWRLCEWGSLMRHIDFEETELKQIWKEVQR